MALVVLFLAVLMAFTDLGVEAGIHEKRLIEAGPGDSLFIIFKKATFRTAGLLRMLAELIVS